MASTSGLTDLESSTSAADRLGHHSAAFTLDRYSHAVEALDTDAAERLQAMMKLARQKAASAS